MEHSKQKKTHSKQMVTRKDLKYLSYLNRENHFSHYSHTEDMAQFEYLKRGDPRAIDEIHKMFKASAQGTLSKDPVRNIKYLFVCSATLACRSAISGGMPPEDAYNASDLYIQRMDRLSTIEEVTLLVYDMFAFYTNYMAELDQHTVISKPITDCIEYIRYHLHEKIHLQDLADLTQLNASYLSVLFKKETGQTVSDYIMDQRIETAANMLRHSKFSYAEISSILAFSSQSHFISAFSKRMHMTPKEYRMKSVNESII